MFDHDISANPFVLYHGTTWEVAAHARIEGLCWRPTVYSRDEVMEVLSIFEELDWAGMTGDGWGVLSACTAAFDFQNGDTKPVFLAGDDHRARMYAKRKWAGGETAGAMRNALGDLRSLATEAGVYRRYLAELAQSRSVVHPLAQQAIAERIAGFADLERRCREPFERFTAGAVIALQFSPDALDSLEFHSMHGVMSHAPIAPERIVAIDRVEESESWDLWDDTALSAPQSPAWRGIIAMLLARRRAEIEKAQQAKLLQG